MPELSKQVNELESKVNTLKEDKDALKDRLDGSQRRLESTETRLQERDTIREAYLEGKKVTGTTNASAGSTTTHNHNLGRKPTFIFITSKSDGYVWLTARTSSDFTVKGSAASLDFEAYCII